MTRTMYDAVTPANIHRDHPDAEMVAGYVNGKYTWKDSDWAMFPNAIHVTITIFIPGRNPPNIGDVLDIEAGDVNQLSVNLATTWAKNRRQTEGDGFRPCIYTSASFAPHFANMDVDLWLAHYTNKPHLIPGTVATQYANPGPYDISLVADHWKNEKGETPMPNEQHSAAPFRKLKLTKSGRGYWMVASDGGVFNYGDAGWHGSLGGVKLNAPIVDFDVAPDEQGYVLLGEDGGVFGFGSLAEPENIGLLGHPTFP